MKKRLLSVLLVLAMLLSFAPAAGAATVTSGKCGDYVRWSYTESTGTLRIYGNGDTWFR